MPMYDYYCKNCAVIHEVLVSLDEIDKKLECPDCEQKLIKMLAMPAIKVN